MCWWARQGVFAPGLVPLIRDHRSFLMIDVNQLARSANTACDAIHKVVTHHAPNKELLYATPTIAVLPGAALLDQVAK